LEISEYKDGHFNGNIIENMGHPRSKWMFTAGKIIHQRCNNHGDISMGILGFEWDGRNILVAIFPRWGAKEIRS
jgi:hypothetical protein